MMISKNHSCQSVVVYVNSYDDGIPSGQFWNVRNHDDKYDFNNMTQLILGIDSMMDDESLTDCELSAQELYSLSMSHTLYWSSNPFPRTLLIKIFFRQHSSWQGSVTDLKNGSVKNFKSVLEIINIMDSALGESFEAESC